MGEAGRLWLRKAPANFATRSNRRTHATLAVHAWGDEVCIQIGFERVLLSAAEREQFAGFYAAASREADQHAAVSGGPA